MRLSSLQKCILVIVVLIVQLNPKQVFADGIVVSKDSESECRILTGNIWGFTWPSFGNKFTIPSSAKAKTRIGAFDKIWISEYLEKLRKAQKLCADAYTTTNSDEMLYRSLLVSLKEKYSDANFEKLIVLAESGYIPSQGFVSMVYYVHFENFESALNWAKIGHQNNSPAASEILGHFYAQGRIVKKNLERAIELYKIAEKEDSHDAAYRLALIHSDDTSKFHDVKIGQKYLEQAYYRGSAKAAIQIGIQKTFGLNGKTDKAQALDYFETAIKRGDFSNGYFNMGLLFASLEPFSEYRFVSHNFYEDAKSVFEKAVRHGNSRAKQYVLEMEKKAAEYPKTKGYKAMVRNNYKRVLAERKKFLQERAERYGTNQGAIAGSQILLGIIGAGILAGSFASNSSEGVIGDDIAAENRRNLNRAITPGVVDLWLK